MPLGIGFDAYCLTDIVRAADVRYLRKWVWALICLAQMPLGGILYLTIGRIRRHGATGHALMTVVDECTKRVTSR